VVVVSSERSAERLARVEALGAVVVHKPFTPEQLGAVLTTITGSRHAVHAR
jgi:DNA-binding response OmpR family regulator